MAAFNSPNLIGSRFGRLVVIKDLGVKGFSINKKRWWLCKCDCGNEVEVYTSTLTSKNTKSCGCLRKEAYRILPRGEASFNELYNDYKRVSLKRGIVFALSKEEFKHITQQPCYYCGCEPDHEFGPKNSSRSRNGLYRGNGIDRKVPSYGYIKDNCVPCCMECNFFKSNLTTDRFLELIIKIYGWRKLYA